MKSFLFKKVIPTPLGSMVAIGNQEGLYLLQFADQPDLKRRIELVEKNTQKTVTIGDDEGLRDFSHELEAFFRGDLKNFTTPLHLFGSPFQKKAWNALLQVPYGETRSYRDQAIAVENPRGCRAVALANSVNQIAVVIPCHRIIQSDGKCGGYGGGVWRKQWLLEHEQKYSGREKQKN